MLRFYATQVFASILHDVWELVVRIFAACIPIPMTALVEENTNTPTLRIEVLGEAPVYSLNMQRVSKKSNNAELSSIIFSSRFGRAKHILANQAHLGIKFAPLHRQTTQSQRLDLPDGF